MERIPVHIKDFLGDYTETSKVSMLVAHKAFTKKYQNNDVANCTVKIYFDSNIEVQVLEPNAFQSTDDLLSEIGFEKAMKTLPTNRIIQMKVRAVDAEANVEYKTNGVRLKVDTDTNFTEFVKQMIEKMHPDSQRLKLSLIIIYGGIYALSCDDYAADFDLQFDSGTESE